MKKTRITFFFIYITLICFTPLYANSLTFEGIKERRFSQKNLEYILQADKKTIDYKNLRKINFFNRKKIVADSIYYENGTLFQKNLQVNFKRAYFYEGNLHMQECYTKLSNGFIQATTAIYKKKYIEFQDVVMKQDDKKYRKFTYKVMLPRYISPEIVK